MTTPNSNPRDPSGFLNLDSSGRVANPQKQGETVVKIVGTARDDLNGLLGFCTSYSQERQRYMVRMASVDTANPQNANTTANPTVMALKPANLAAASTLESYKAQFQQLQTNPAVRRRIAEYYSIAEAKCRPLHLKPEQAFGAALVLLFGTIYYVGFTRMLMLGACSILLGTLLAEDVLVRRKPWREVAQGLPARCNALLCQQFPTLRGRLTDAMAAGLVGLLVAFTIQSVFFAGSSTTSGKSRPVVPPPHSSRVPSALSSRTAVDREVLEEFYNLGFRDSLEGKERGHSFAGEMEQLLQATTSTSSGDDGDDLRYAQPPPLTMGPPPPMRKTFLQRLVSVKTAGSVFYLYRVAMQIGVDRSTGIFSLAQLAANIQHQMPPWQKGMLAFSCYNLLSGLFF
mmetsp:Transcript_61/g.107  ORF Transcript_61/g.107 Transcript_61/m.107 type:complete len:400 (+) Transcript_61:412-1611(+)